VGQIELTETLERETAKQALSGYVVGETANQIEFLDLIVNHLTEHGIMDASLLYESPFTDVAPLGPEGIFTSAQVTEIVRAIEKVNARAEAA